MDTKWNGTSEVLDGEIVEIAPLDKADKPGWGRSILSFLAFFLGLSLMAGALGAAVGRLAWGWDTQEWWRSDWQDTAAFRWQVVEYLEDFLTLGAGGELQWYETSEAREYGVDTAYQDILISSGYGVRPLEEAQSITVPAEDEGYQRYLMRTDARFQDDKNVLYRIWTDGWEKFSNTDGITDSLGGYQSLPEGYNFLLIYRDGKVTICKDGQDLDVYGDGVYTEDSRWFVPGYENFQAGEDVDGVSVYLAVREIPIQYVRGDYANGTVNHSGRMYWLYQDLADSRAAYGGLLLAFCAGAALLGLWYSLRRDRARVDKKLASWTVHVWTEFRFLAVALCLWGLLVYCVLGINWYELWYEGIGGYSLRLLAMALGRGLSDLTALLGLLWTAWLIRNDHRYNPREGRRSLWRLLRVRELKYPLQKRMSRLAGLAGISFGMLALVAGYLFLVIVWNWGLDSPLWWYALIFGPCVLALALLVWVLERQKRIWTDLGAVSDHAARMRSGQMDRPLALPQGHDLAELADDLNHIQQGLHQAVEERTRSERMKVELVTNVSHDLKTPLTSIISYTELLAQEPLEPPASEYVRILGEKSQRLKAMVQDVFEVSKAASGQLPVDLERLDFGRLLRQTLADMDGAVRDSGLALRTAIPEEPVPITADSDRMYRVFQNLIGNALKYSLAGSRVYLSLTVEGDRAAARVKNTSASELKPGTDYTGRFVRGDESRTDGGSGLGLSIADSFTRACGGELTVTTEADLFIAEVSFPLEQ